MPSSASLVPAFDVAAHIVLDDFAKDDRVYRETDEADAGFETVIEDLLTGQYNSPVRVAFNTSEGWARDVSEDVAREIVKRHQQRGTGLDRGLRRFLTRYVDENALAPSEE